MEKENIDVGIFLSLVHYWLMCRNSGDRCAPSAKRMVKMVLARHAYNGRMHRLVRGLARGLAIWSSLRAHHGALDRNCQHHPYSALHRRIMAK